MSESAATHPLRILIVEDDPLQAQALRLELKHQGYRVLGVAATAAEAERLFRAEPPDLLLLDIHLAPDEEADTPPRDGIEVAETLLANRPTPLIFLSSLADEATFRRAQRVVPAAFLVKPFVPDTLRRAIELAVLRAAGPAAEPTLPAPTSPVLALLPDALFVRRSGRLERVMIESITYITAEAGNSDLRLTGGDKYTLPMGLGELIDCLPPGRFIRIHRTYIVAWAVVESVDYNEMEIRLTGGIRLPIGRTYRDDILRVLPLLG